MLLKYQVQALFLKDKMTAGVLKNLVKVIDYQSEVTKIIEKKLPKNYQYLAKHALNLSNLLVGFIPHSDIVSMIKTFEKADKIEKKRLEQQEILDDPENSLTATELNKSIEETKKQIKNFKIEQAEMRIENEGMLDFQSEIIKLLKNQQNEEVSEVEVLKAIFTDIKQMHKSSEEYLLKRGVDIEKLKQLKEKNKYFLDNKNSLSEKTLVERIMVFKRIVIQETKHLNEIIEIINYVEKSNNKNKYELVKLFEEEIPQLLNLRHKTEVNVALRIDRQFDPISQTQLTSKEKELLKQEDFSSVILTKLKKELKDMSEKNQQIIEKLNHTKLEKDLESAYYTYSLHIDFGEKISQGIKQYDELVNGYW